MVGFCVSVYTGLKCLEVIVMQYVWLGQMIGDLDTGK